MVNNSDTNAALEYAYEAMTYVTLKHQSALMRDQTAFTFFEGQAGRAAIDIQLGISQMAPVEKVKLGVRIGMNWGPVVEREGVNRAGTGASAASGRPRRLGVDAGDLMTRGNERRKRRQRERRTAHEHEAQAPTIGHAGAYAPCFFALPSLRRMMLRLTAEM